MNGFTVRLLEYGRFARNVLIILEVDQKELSQVAGSERTNAPGAFDTV